MIKRFFKSQYAKIAITAIVAGSALILIYSSIGKVEIGNVISWLNSELLPVYLGIAISFLMCPMYNSLVKGIYGYLNGRVTKKENEGILETPDCEEDVSEDHGAFEKIKELNQKEKKQDTQEHRNLRRAKAISSIVCVVVIIVVILLLIYSIIPQLITSIISFIETLPSSMRTLSAWAAAAFPNYPQIAETIDSISAGTLDDFISWITSYLASSEVASTAITSITGGLSSLWVVGSALIDVVLGLIIAIYLLNYKDTLFAIARKIGKAYFSEKNNEYFTELFNVINDTFINFLVGRIIDSTIMGVLTFLCMSLFNLPSALMISVIVGVTNIIPFFGPFIGAIPSAFIILLQSPIKALYFVILILVLQQIDGNIIGPRVVGRQIGLDSFWILIAVVIAGRFFGFLGMLLGVPVFAVIYVYVNKAVSKKLVADGETCLTNDYIDLENYGIDKEELARMYDRPVEDKPANVNSADEQ